MSFEFATPQTLEEALALWQEDGNAYWFAGGTDLVPKIKTALARPTRLVNLKEIKELHSISESDEGLRIGSLVTLTELAENRAVREHYRVLSEACALAASPQLRNMATIGGNLNQDSRCSYYRGAYPCWLKGGQICYMREGENREASIVGYHECVHVHPSDPANALVALDAKIITRAKSESREIPAMDFFRAPADGDRRMNVLQPGEVIAEIRLPRFPNSRSTYLKAMDRAVWTFVLVSAAVRLDFDGGRLSAARLVLGGIAPIPWCAREVESSLPGQELTEQAVEAATARALPEVQPLPHNAYKRRLARALLKRAILQVATPVVA